MTDKKLRTHEAIALEIVYSSKRHPDVIKSIKEALDTAVANCEAKYSRIKECPEKHHYNSEEWSGCPVCAMKSGTGIRIQDLQAQVEKLKFSLSMALDKDSHAAQIYLAGGQLILQDEEIKKQKEEIERLKKTARINSDESKQVHDLMTLEIERLQKLKRTHIGWGTARRFLHNSLGSFKDPLVDTLRQRIEVLENSIAIGRENLGKLRNLKIDKLEEKLSLYQSTLAKVVEALESIKEYGFRNNTENLDKVIVMRGTAKEALHLVKQMGEGK